MTVSLQFCSDQLLSELPTILCGNGYADTSNHDRHAVVLHSHLGPYWLVHGKHHALSWFVIVVHPGVLTVIIGTLVFFILRW
jgi:hypothetical protein